jgi:gliding motility-associated-like protein
MANPRGWFGRAGNAEKISLTVKNKSGCAATTDTTLVVKGLTKYLFPSAFTPNGDNKNEGFGIAGPEYVKTYKLWIFNRWGEQVFYTEDPNELWQPSKMQTGMYVYKAKVQDLYSRWEEVNGTVTLLR